SSQCIVTRIDLLLSKISPAAGFVLTKSRPAPSAVLLLEGKKRFRVRPCRKRTERFRPQISHSPERT
ncbi:hypothetical protein O7A60_30485, partial [Mesorhizobium sp. Ld1326N3]